MDNKKFSAILIIEALIFIILGIFIIGRYNDKIETLSINMVTHSQQLDSVKLKNGELIYTRNLYIMNNQNLKDELFITRNNLKKLEKELQSKVDYIADLNSHIKLDTIEIIRDSVVYTNKDTTYHFSHSSYWVELIGRSRLTGGEMHTDIDHLHINAPLTVGITDKRQIFVKTDNPYMYISDIKGAEIDKSTWNKQASRLSMGVQIGIGTSYDLVSKNIGFGPYCGLGINIKF